VSARLRAGILLLVLAIGTTGGTTLAQTILLPRPVPSFNQNYVDGPDAWGDCPLGTSGCPDRISTTGCLVSAFSCVLAYYEIELDVSAGFSCTGSARSGMDPGILNDWLREHGGFGRCAQDPYGSCCLIWDELPDRIELTEYSNRSETGVNPVASVVIDHALREGRPIIAGVHWDPFCRAGSDQAEDCHWVVVTGKVGETYTIVDPINPDSADRLGVRTTLDAGTRGHYIIDRFYVVSALPAEDETGEIHVLPGDSAGTDETEGLPGAGLALALLGLAAAAVAIIFVVSRR